MCKNEFAYVYVYVSVSVYVYIYMAAGYMADASPSGRALFSEPFYSPCLAKKMDFITAKLFDVDTLFLNYFDALDMKNGILAAIWGTFWEQIGWNAYFYRFFSTIVFKINQFPVTMSYSRTQSLTFPLF